MLEKIVIANRGEIALRILRACKELGIKTVATYSVADREQKHVYLADESVCIGPAASIDSYLNIPAVISAAEVTDAVGIHPGYGFLSENADFDDYVFLKFPVFRNKVHFLLSKSVKKSTLTALNRAIEQIMITEDYSNIYGPENLINITDETAIN